MKRAPFLFFGLIILCSSSCKPTLCEPNANDVHCDLPDRVGFINDYCHLLSAAEIVQLEKTISDFYAKTGTAIIIVTEDSNRSHSRKFHNGCAISKKWDLEKTENCDDIIIAIARKRHYIDIAYGTSIRKVLTTQDHKNILYKNMVPAFNKKQFYKGLDDGIAYIISHLKST